MGYIPVIVVSSLMVVLCFTSSHPKTESKLNDIKKQEVKAHNGYVLLLLRVHNNIF